MDEELVPMLQLNALRPSENSIKKRRSNLQHRLDACDVASFVEARNAGLELGFDNCRHTHVAESFYHYDPTEAMQRWIGVKQDLEEESIREIRARCVFCGAIRPL
jgi:hypothetical protein